MKILAFLIVGISCGVIFAKYQLCFAAAVRNLIAFGKKDKMILFLIMIVASAILLNLFIGLGLRTETVKELMPMTFLGGILFGMGMILAGGCTAGTLYRVGEGSIPAFISALGMIGGMATFGFVVASRFTKQLPHFVGSTILKTLNINPLIFALVVAVFSLLLLIYLRTEKGDTKGKLRFFLVIGLVVILNVTLVYELVYFKYSNCQQITSLVLKDTIARGEDVVILDIRPENFFKANHIENAILMGSLPNGLKDMQKYKDKMVVVVCGEGIISELFCIKMNKTGFKKVYNLKGGMGEWS